MVLLAGCAGTGDGGSADGGGDAVSVTDAVVGASHATDAAAYLVVTNPGGTDRLVGVTSPDVSEITMHETDDSGGISAMRKVESLEVPAHGELRLDPGGTHLMLVGVSKAVEAGDTIPLHVTFDSGTTLDVKATAVPLQDLPDRLAR